LLGPLRAVNIRFAAAAIFTRRSTAKRMKLSDMLGRAAVPRRDVTAPSSRPVWWWKLFMPGKVILWFEYMFPRSFRGVFGSARRRDVPIIQAIYSIVFYAIVIILTMLLMSSRDRS
jgi:hypothetical protein